MQKQTKTSKLTILAMLTALAYLIMVVGRIPVVMFLKYDPKDVILTIGGFLFGPLSALSMTVVVSFIEMFTVSDSGFIGLVMNILASCAFACTAAVIYKRKRTLNMAIIALFAGCVCMTVVMLLWNYLLTPIYMGMPREAVTKLLLPVLLPFNLLKSGLNAAFTMILYKPISNALHKQGFLPYTEGTESTDSKLNLSVLLGAAFIIMTCVIVILVHFSSGS